MTVFVSPTQPIEFKILKIRNKTDHERLLQITPSMEIVLAETPNESLGVLESIIDENVRIRSTSAILAIISCRAGPL